MFKIFDTGSQVLEWVFGVGYGVLVFLFCCFLTRGFKSRTHALVHTRPGLLVSIGVRTSSLKSGLTVSQVLPNTWCSEKKRVSSPLQWNKQHMHLV